MQIWYSYKPFASHANKKNNSYIYDIVPKLYAYMSGMRSTFIILGVVVKSCFDIE